MSNAIRLIEDNAGGLFIGCKDGPWYDVTNVQNNSSFADDAPALANNDLDNWTVESYAEEPQGDVIAVWKDGEINVYQTSALAVMAGIAGRNYLRINVED